MAILIRELLMEELTLAQDIPLPQHHMSMGPLRYHSLALLTFQIVQLTYLALILGLTEMFALESNFQRVYFGKCMYLLYAITATAQSSTIFYDIRIISFSIVLISFFPRLIEILTYNLCKFKV